MSKKTIHKESYKAAFSGDAKHGTKVANALAVALDVRKFEIGLYWQRASYFWVFTGAALAGHLAALSEQDIKNRPPIMLLTSCVGVVFAFAWHLVNRASKFWQSNWEAHVDLLEDEVNGPLYKTVFSDEDPWWKVHGAYGFSVSKINQILSFYVFLMFGLLILNTVCSYYEFSCHPQIFPTSCLLITATALFLLIWLGRTGNKDRFVHQRQRRTAILNDTPGENT